MRWMMLGCATLLAVALGCEEMDAGRTPLPNVDTSKPDNSAVNERDAKGQTVTPLDQGQNSADVERTAEIRRKVLDLPNISLNARNVKIITLDGKVTLRGPVANREERDAIERAAVDVAGDGNVVNELEVPPPKP